MPREMLPLTRKEVIAEGTMAFWFDISEIELDFKPGQYGNFTINDMEETDEKGNRRPFSIASSPKEDELMIATRMRDSAFKNTLKRFEEGDEIQFAGPIGIFTLHEDTSKPAVMIAGGIGITPFHSMIKWSTEEDSGHKIYLFYSNRTPESTAFLEELEEFAEMNDNFKLIPTITDSEDPDWEYEYGMITPDMIREKVEEDVDECIHYVVGPPGMVQGVSQTLQDAGFPPSDIITEDFSGY